MKNVVLSMLAKISQIDASTKQLTARVEAQSLLISALVLAVSKQGGVTEIIEGANKAINTVIDSADSDEVLKTDAALLLSELQDLLTISRAVDHADEEINYKGLNALTGITASGETN
ncbi:MAG: anti-adapter protein IraP [Pantoea sp.]|uniref:anti-adapter protein IraP n=1 Tax=Pantoea septica TaxID=472695 RepID=UPI000E87B632|nr:anti-adapter protein IraP [Pantoea septica]MBU5379554.1 anti-adapter protein IraP [Pantoea septica]MDU5836552.1 anti-adapter protein IraP [Pantoea sp.]MDU6438897.1 anti-adapter protein IraP [Pantoea sp.]HAT24247.1 anti-adapter protein IraP [Pantoea septica]